MIDIDIDIYIFLCAFHYIAKVRNKTTYEGPSFRGTFHTQFWLTAI